ncbi:MAG: glycoside hydrolase [Mucilaginibacter sp.]|nr:glycoside hydrolase [Mucilaginibacter sp.]
MLIYYQYSKSYFTRNITVIMLYMTATCNLVCGQVLNKSFYKHYIDNFNQHDHENYQPGDFNNKKAWSFLKANIPFFDCPDKQLEKTYYFRWWTYRKHIRNTPEGYVITEFLPDVPWAGKYNAISCAAPHHFMEGRWLKEGNYLKEYANYWLTGAGKLTLRKYSVWIADALVNYTNVHPDDALLHELFPYLEQNFRQWEKGHRDSTGLFWQTDNADGMEVSISGSYPNADTKGYRATLNSYMYAEAKALMQISLSLKDPLKTSYYQKVADSVRENINQKLWDNQAQFYKVIPLNNRMAFSRSYELHGYTPWYFNIPPAAYSIAWKYLMDPRYFYAPYGPTSAARNDPDFKISYQGHECQWNGPSWPFATSITLTAMANLLNNYQQSYLSKADFVRLLTIYSRSHRITLENGQSQPWIDEDLNPFTGDWIARTVLKKAGHDEQAVERGKDYNHSTFNDIIINDLIGVRPAATANVIISPLIPANKWDYYCLDDLNLKHKRISIFYDKTGLRYHRHKGYYILINGKTVFKANTPKRAVLDLK